MKENLIFGRSVTPTAAATGCSDPDYTLNVALVYQDEVTGAWAYQVRTRLAQVVGNEAIHCTEWKIDELRKPGAFAESIAALAQADAIVIAVDEAQCLPAQFYLWVNLWLQQRHGAAGSLVALIGASDQPRRDSAGIRKYLKAIANQGRLEFLLKDCCRLATRRHFVTEGRFQWAAAI